MATKHKGLGRGLDALLSGESEPETPREAAAPLTLPLDQLKPGKYQPRTRMDQASLAELAESIKSQGVIQPVLVRKLEAGGYEIIAGERRTRAARIAGLTEVPVLVKVVADEAAAVMALIENIQREDLNPLEEAHGLQRLISEFKLTQEQAAQAVGRSRSAVANLLRLTNLPRPIQDQLHAGEIDMGHARALLAIEGADQLALAFEITKKNLSVRAVEEMVRRLLDRTLENDAPKIKPKRSRDIERLEEEMSEKLGTKVEIAAGKKGGKLVIHYSSNDHLGDLLERVK
ncbi:MAG: Chromosome partitioning protein parB [Betaproteobacteria bacterium]|nr:Chromosome partitioning protein parB [Betaproteobacteria bacterium]